MMMYVQKDKELSLEFLVFHPRLTALHKNAGKDLETMDDLSDHEDFLDSLTVNEVVEKEIDEIVNENGKFASSATQVSFPFNGTG